MSISHEELLDVLDYDEETGVFRWKRRISIRVSVGKVAGAKDRGYVKIRVRGTVYYAHRLAFFYVHGRWPEHAIDHVNGDRSDNRISNLRDVPMAINTRNMALKNTNVSGVNGVHREPRTLSKPWRATMTVNGKPVHIGYFRTREEAAAARRAAEREHGFTARHGREVMEH